MQVALVTVARFDDGDLRVRPVHDLVMTLPVTRYHQAFKPCQHGLAQVRLGSEVEGTHVIATDRDFLEPYELTVAVEDYRALLARPEVTAHQDEACGLAPMVEPDIDRSGVKARVRLEVLYVTRRRRRAPARAGAPAGRNGHQPGAQGETTTEAQQVPPRYGLSERPRHLANQERWLVTAEHLANLRTGRPFRPFTWAQLAHLDRL